MSFTELVSDAEQPGWDEETEDGFDPEARTLRLGLPLPPPDNMCHRSGAYGRYATAPYRDWLALAAKRLRALLGPWPADTEGWWGVDVSLWMGSRSDGANHLKPLLDLLGGSYVPEKGERDPLTGKLADRDKIQKTNQGLFLNDRRVRWALPNVITVHCAEPRCMVVASPAPAPRDERAEREAAERAEKTRLHLEEVAFRVRRAVQIGDALVAAGVTGKIPAAVMEQVAPRFQVSEGVVRAAWKAYRESLPSAGRKAGCGG